MATVYDRRRVNGPDETYQPMYNLSISNSEGEKPLWSMNEYTLLQDPKAVPKESITLHTQATGPDGLHVARIAQKSFQKRIDGRGAHDLRPICASCILTLDIQPGIIPSASGSALLESGNSKILCAV